MERVGDYVIESKLSQGGMAEVFLAHSSTHQRQVVVKSLFGDRADAKMAAMMVEEARIAARLSHPNVVQVLDLVESEGRPFIVMEYLDGQNLRQLMHRAATTHRRLSPAAACRVVLDVLSALGYAHRRTDEEGAPLGLVHRDVSPANVLVTWSGHVKLIDFGVAKATRGADRGLTRCGEIKGKVAYMSPEQIQRRPLDGRSDLFSMGIILWEALTLRRLFARKADFETLVAVMEGEVPAPSTFATLPVELDAICKKALSRDVGERYGSAEEMAADLEAVIAAEGWDASPSALRREIEALFQDEMEAELFPAAADPVLELPTQRTTVRGEPQAIAALNDAPTDPNLYESWDDAARSYKARGLSSGFRIAIAAACLLLGAAAAGVARQITSPAAPAAVTASVR
jgi:serine/threonine protein kinase